jgi:hypothetical protein
LLLEATKRRGRHDLAAQIECAGKEFDEMSLKLTDNIEGIQQDLDSLLKNLDAQKFSIERDKIKNHKSIADQLAQLKKMREEALAGHLGGSLDRLLKAIDER